MILGILIALPIVALIMNDLIIDKIDAAQIDFDRFMFCAYDHCSMLYLDDESLMWANSVQCTH